ncbi:MULTISPECIES: alpha/beta fold hydrolase [Rhodomicrobium]|uniref:alpha/beta fold hydrolase n=1 Tax=Rhodomicrobium TaxID=1068 RepID=UPI000B4BF5C5|nr:MULTISPECIES: alpha/beta fold hydrolase [Rhodomicrobium]
MAIPRVSLSPSRPIKSTSGHAVTVPIPGFLRLAFRAASAISPKLGAEFGRQIFFTPPRPRYSPTQREILSRAERHDFTSEGHKVAAYSWGDGPPVLLVHGWGGHAGHLAEFVAPIVAAGHRAVAIDLPAHGASGGRLSSIVHFGTAIIVAAHRFGPLHGVVAHSLGSAGLIRAILGGLAPGRVVLIAAPAQFHDYWGLFRRSLGVSDAVWEHMLASSERRLGVPFTEIHPAVGAPKMTAPALILHGLADPVSPIAEGRELARLWPGARLMELEAGHLSILKDERAIRAATLFLGS